MDMQMIDNYISASNQKVPMDQVTCIRRLELCIAEIRCWMKTNFLKLNDSKTEFILLGT